MDIKEMFKLLDQVLDESKIAVLANIDEKGRPQMRWMSPSLVRGQEGLIYAVTSPSFSKPVQLEKNPEVQWMVQSKGMDKILSIRGKMQVLDNPSLKSTVIEAIGGKLRTFWKLNQDEEIVVLETIIEEMELFYPVKGEKYSVKA